MRGDMSYISQVKKKENMMWIFLLVGGLIVQGHTIDIIC
jgi:hypothetical protein